MGKKMWTDPEIAVIADNPKLSNRALAVLVTALGVRECTADDVKSRRYRLGQPKDPEGGKWPMSAVATLKEHWDAGLAPSQIAKLMPGYSRYAILGKGERLGWKKHDWSGVVSGKGLHRARADAQLKAVNWNKPAPDAPRAQPSINKLKVLPWEREFARPWITRREGECKWPIGEGANTLSCCRKVDRSGYCRGHSERAFQAKAPTGRKSDKEWARSLRRYVA